MCNDSELHVGLEIRLVEDWEDLITIENQQRVHILVLVLLVNERVEPNTVGIVILDVPYPHSVQTSSNKVLSAHQVIKVDSPVLIHCLPRSKLNLLRVNFDIVNALDMKVYVKFLVD